jgi:hypothetical protein
MNNSFGIGSIAILIVAFGSLGFIYAKSKEALKGESKALRQPFLQVLKTVSPYGICLALGGLGFGTISTFITLYYAALHWKGAVLCLSVFSVMFIMGRVIFARAIDNYGGMKTAVYCLGLESAGMMILWLANVPHVALIGQELLAWVFPLSFLHWVLKQ